MCTNAISNKPIRLTFSEEKVHYKNYFKENQGIRKPPVKKESALKPTSTATDRQSICIQLDTLLTQGQINLALNKECRHSSKIGPAIEFLPGCAVDGNRAQHIAQGAACSHTALFEPFNWWTVDLGQQYTVDTITIYKRADSCCRRYVQIYKQNGVDFIITESPLTLCEVEVYGPRNLTDTEDTVIDTTSRTSLSTYAEDTMIETTTEIVFVRMQKSQ
ncbi:unnamed protein product [Mytilus edulis]|uniref:Fucolectin tachylectin-4 pentraxin-1 domain-containing protein n=1 Tax=Mytilus edulis TaxID=6550 RepID=A0A8S3Q4V7_MYTED|nr:unnamed protein product [Mytilus edulis]